ncbi:DnaD/phage-associated family protein [Metabacillus crassostreae]|uniref:DnaD domain-containing protein n=1 Tax=Metabacillus crassostreae TaxID=929098 RepID=UPI001EF779E2|nr:DnaD domain protein [Metabacillus crassostreae]MBM7602546.1 DnaD/phage-associated family protein [Metabacillus crassostreae]
MALYRMIRCDFWDDLEILDEMTIEDRYFYFFLLTNIRTTQIGIYKISKKKISAESDLSIEKVHSLVDRFVNHHKLIRYNPVTREIAIRNWGKHNLNKGGKPMVDCIKSELKQVIDISLIPFISEAIEKKEMRSLYDDYYHEKQVNQDSSNQVEAHTYQDSKSDDVDEKETLIASALEQDKLDQEDNTNAENDVNIKQLPQKKATKDVSEIVGFWDNNGFGLSNVNAKEQLLSWLEHSNFLQPKKVILKALTIACANNKRKLNYVVGILKNWDHQSLRTVEEIDLYQEKQTKNQKHNTYNQKAGRAIPGEFVLDITAGEDG